jgi:polyribonucleotide nucleotidyltransferase
VNDLKQRERAQLLRIDDLKLEVLSEETKNKDKTLRLQDMKRAQEQLKYHLKTAKNEIDTITASTNASIDLLNQQVVKAKNAENRALDNCKNMRKKSCGRVSNSTFVDDVQNVHCEQSQENVRNGN